MEHGVFSFFLFSFLRQLKVSNNEKKNNYRASASEQLLLASSPFMRGNFTPFSVKELTAFPYNEKEKRKKHNKENQAQENCAINADEENQNISSHSGNQRLKSENFSGKVLQRIITIVAMTKNLIHRLMTTTNNLRVLCL